MKIETFKSITGLRNSGAIENSLTFEVDKDLTNSGTITNTGAMTTKKLTNSGTMTHEGTLSSTELVNEGTLIGDGWIRVQGPLTNSGTFTTLDNTDSVTNTTTSVVNSGTFTNSAEWQTTSIVNSGVLVNNGGTLETDTFVSSGAYTAGGTLKALDRMDFIGGEIIGAGGSLQIRDFLNITDNSTVTASTDAALTLRTNVVTVADTTFDLTFGASGGTAPVITDSIFRIQRGVAFDVDFATGFKLSDGDIFNLVSAEAGIFVLNPADLSIALPDVFGFEFDVALVGQQDRRQSLRATASAVAPTFPCLRAPGCSARAFWASRGSSAAAAPPLWLPDTRPKRRQTVRPQRAIPPRGRAFFMRSRRTAGRTPRLWPREAVTLFQV